MPDDKVHAEFVRYYELLERFSADYRSDSELKARIDGGDAAPAVAALGLEDLQREVEIRVVSNTPDVLHVVLPPPEERQVPDSMLEMVVGGVGAAHVGSLMTMMPFLQVTLAQPPAA